MLKQKHTTKIILVTGLILLIAAVPAYLIFNRNNKRAEESPKETVNYTEATNDEKSETDANKQEVIKQTEEENTRQNQSPPATGSTRKVSPVISYIGQESPGSELQANGYTPEIIEKDGICTLTLTKGSTSVKTTRTSMVNAQDTTCGLMIIPKSKLANGTWSATLSYSSSKSSGSSDKVSVEVR